MARKERNTNHPIQLPVAYIYVRVGTHLSSSPRRDESRKPLANGLLSIFNFVICNEKNKNKYVYDSTFVVTLHGKKKKNTRT